MSFIPAWAEDIVSRETMVQLQSYRDLLAKWSPKINLVSKNDLSQLMDRHILDCAQLWHSDRIRTASEVVDVGSGGGLPAVVLAILGKANEGSHHITCIESDARKCAFLNTVSFELQLNMTITCARIEDVTIPTDAIVTARAFASLKRMFELLDHAQKSDLRFVLPKGQSWRAEVLEAQQSYAFNYIAHPSKTDERAAILEISNVKRL